uniref:Solute carrier family 35 member F1 n=1 Tax=Eptatretus burgeri TaxID=7764 RepID=A0A8C4Q3Z2_EPTBU
MWRELGIGIGIGIGVSAPLPARRTKTAPMAREQKLISGHNCPLIQLKSVRRWPHDEGVPLETGRGPGQDEDDVKEGQKDCEGRKSPSTQAGTWEDIKDKVQEARRRVCTRQVLFALLLGQLLSLLLCGTGLTSQLLADEFKVNTPLFQSLLNYILLFIVYSLVLILHIGQDRPIVPTFHLAWKYALLGIVDVEANYLIITAYQYTTLTSIQLLDCFVLPVVLLLSRWFLDYRFRAAHIVAVAVCILGVTTMVGADAASNHKSGNETNQLLGDLLVLGGAALYGISNVGQEYMLQTRSQPEFLAMLGLSASLITGIQIAITERSAVASIKWDWRVGLLLVAFALCMFILYSLMPIALRLSGATAVNLSILTADLYSLLLGLFIFHYVFSWLYLLSFGTITLGLLLYFSIPIAIVQRSNAAPPPAPDLSAAPADFLPGDGHSL